jgi:hypothetical protein
MTGIHRLLTGLLQDASMPTDNVEAQFQQPWSDKNMAIPVCHTGNYYIVNYNAIKCSFKYILGQLNRISKM